MKKKTIELNSTISYCDDDTGHNEVHDTLTVYEPSVQQMVEIQALKDDDLETGIDLFARICRVSPPVIEMLGISEYRKIQTIVKGWEARVNRSAKNTHIVYSGSKSEPETAAEAA